MGQRDDDRGGRTREDDRGSRDRDRGSDDRGRDSRDRGRDEGRSRDRDDRGRDDRGGGRDSGRGSSFEYQRRSTDDMRERAADNSKFDKFLDGSIKMFKPNDGENRVRLLPPTWAGAKHYGVDVWMHYGVGADRQSYICPAKMKDEDCPVCNERAKFSREADTDNDDDKTYLKDLSPKLRVVVFLVDRDHERDGVQAWAMPEGLDKDIVKISVDHDTGEVLPIDHPEEGFDVIFDKSGSGLKTKYEGVNIARRSSPLGDRKWLAFAVDNPLPKQLIYFDAAHIDKAFGGGAGPGASNDRGRDSRDNDRDRGRDDRQRDDRRDDRRGSDDRDRDRGRDEKAVLTYESVHEMRQRELEDLIEAERIKINPKEAKDTADLAAWICEELKLTKAPARDEGRRRMNDDPPSREDDRRIEDMRDRMRRRD